MICRADEYPSMFAPAIVDLFAGAGGYSIGLEQAFVDAGYRDKFVDLAINHWDTAVSVHQRNHLLTEHACASVFEVDPDSVLRGRRIAYLHASPDCTHFSKARGSKPVKKEIRGLAWVVIRWARKRRPSVITLENVEEFKTWGPLAPGIPGTPETPGQPDPAKKGQTFRTWVQCLQRLGYAVEHRELRACDYGAPTTRKRLFIIARCDGKPIIWPEATHGKEHTDSIRPASSLDEGKCANNRSGSGDGNEIAASKPRAHVHVASKSQRREVRTGVSSCRGVDADRLGMCDGRGVRRGMQPDQKAAAQRPHPNRGDSERIGGCGDLCGPSSGSARHRSGRSSPREVQRSERPQSGQRLSLKPYRTAAECIDWSIPMCSIFATPEQAKAWARQHGQHRPKRPLAEKTLARIARGVMKYVVASADPFIVQVQNGSNTNGVHGVGDPLPTVTANPKGGGHALVSPTIVRVNHGDTSANGGKRRGKGAHPIGEPLPTVTGQHGFAVAGACLIPRHGEREGQAARCRSVEEPMPTVTGTGNGAQLVAAFLAKHYGDKGQRPGIPMGEPMSTITGADHHALTAASLVKLKGTAKDGQRLDEPLATVQAGGNHHALTATFLTKHYSSGGQLQGVGEPIHTIPGIDNFGLVTVTLNGVPYVVTDIAMRMLTPRELARAQGFPDDYEIDRGVDGKRLSKRDQVKLIGNSVAPPVARAIVAANVADPVHGVLDEVPEAAEVMA